MILFTYCGGNWCVAWHHPQHHSQIGRYQPIAAQRPRDAWQLQLTCTWPADSYTVCFKVCLNSWSSSRLHRALFFHSHLLEGWGGGGGWTCPWLDSCTPKGLCTQLANSQKKKIPFRLKGCLFFCTSSTPPWVDVKLRHAAVFLDLWREEKEDVLCLIQGENLEQQIHIQVPNVEQRL